MIIPQKRLRPALQTTQATSALPARVRTRPALATSDPKPTPVVSGSASPPARLRAPAALPAPLVRYKELPGNLKSHNGLMKVEANDKQDTRFAPLVIIVPARFYKAMPLWAATRLEQTFSWDETTDFTKVSQVAIVPSFIHETACRKYLKSAMMADVVFERLKDYVASNEGMWNEPQRCILSLANGTLTADHEVATGPYYLDVVAVCEHHYPTKMRRLNTT